MIFKGKSSTAMELVMNKISVESNPKKHRLSKDVRSKHGKLKSDDWSRIYTGLEVVKSLLENQVSLEN